MAKTKKRVVVLGRGFAGIETAGELIDLFFERYFKIKVS